MPELPEVEIIKNGLKNKIVGKEIADIEVRAQKLFQGSKESVIGAKINSIDRFAKMIVVGLSNGRSDSWCLMKRRAINQRESPEGIPPRIGWRICQINSRM